VKLRRLFQQIHDVLVQAYAFARSGQGKLAVELGTNANVEAAF
jgi:hypothetical protein